MEILTFGEAAAYLKIKTSTLYRLTSRRDIPHFKIGRLLRFNRQDLDAWLVGQKVDFVGRGDDFDSGKISPVGKWV